VSSNSSWQNRIVRYGEASPSELTAHPDNWRTHPDKQAAALAGVLSDVGIVQNIIVNEQTGHVLDGHLRLELARQQKQPTVPVTYVDLSAEEEALILATLDPIGAMAGQDDQILARLLGRVQTEDGAVLELLSSLSGEPVPKPGLTDPDEVPDAPAEPISRRGDLWILGDHRLLCGDATDRDDVIRLMNGEEADLLVTDPPYGVEYVGKTKQALTIQNDRLGDNGTQALVAAALRGAPLKPGGSFYVCSPAGSSETVFRLALLDAGLELRQCLVWVKDQFVMGRQDYHWRHESILYGWKDGAAHRFVNDRTQDTVWEIDRPRRSAEHPTIKPIELVTRALRNSSRHGDLVLDLFGGSGTTLIACESLSRRGAMIELDPVYCDVAVARWEQFTGRTSVRESAEMAAD
jgi:DNA modification methylase